MTAPSGLAAVLAEARACRLCEGRLALGPRPVLRAQASARLLIVGQAPGSRVHASGVPFDDPSGDRLRAWMGIDRDTFYDHGRIAILPMGLCYPGRDAHGGDLPPIAECAPIWHPRVRAELPAIALTLLVGGYAQRAYLGAACGNSVGETVAAWRRHLPRFLPTPHPSWRTRAWAAKRPWFESELVPALRARVAAILAGTDAPVAER